MDSRDDIIQREWIGQNVGVHVLSPFIPGQPLAIGGAGRSGTTSLARAIITSGVLPFVADDVSPGANLESVGLNRILSCGHASSLREFRERTCREYSPEFAFKNPCLESYCLFQPELSKAWEGANVIVMFRDHVAVLARERSLLGPGDDPELLPHQVAERGNQSMLGAVELSRICGVALISYEKLITMPEEVFHSVNSWAGKELLTKKGLSSIQPNEVGYLTRQTLGKYRHRPRSG